MNHIFSKLSLLGVLLFAYGGLQCSNPPAIKQKQNVLQQVFDALKRDDKAEVGRLLNQHPLLKVILLKKMSTGELEGHNKQFADLALLLRSTLIASLNKINTPNLKK